MIWLKIGSILMIMVNRGYLRFTVVNHVSMTSIRIESLLWKWFKSSDSRLPRKTRIKPSKSHKNLWIRILFLILGSLWNSLCEKITDELIFVWKAQFRLSQRVRRKKLLLATTSVRVSISKIGDITRFFQLFVDCRQHTKSVTDMLIVEIILCHHL